MEIGKRLMQKVGISGRRRNLGQKIVIHWRLELSGWGDGHRGDAGTHTGSANKDRRLSIENRTGMRSQG